ncbi:MAG: hypothetical protein E7311_04660 [Clostridiales bacterium]|nr:hypothetical protein [Clostridiales bacterium]
MINNKKGNAAIINLISVVITVIIIVAVGVIYYIFLSPEKLELKEIVYENIDKKDYEIDKEFEEGLDTSIEVRYTDDELDMHRDLKDYYQGREDPFSQSDNRNEVLELDGLTEEEERTTNSRPDLAPVLPDDEESEIDLDNTTPTGGNSSFIKL